MKKTLLLIGILAWVMVLVVVVVIFAGGIFAGGRQMGASGEMLKEESIGLPANANIYIDADSAEVELFVTAEEQLRVRQYGGGNARDLFTVAVNGDNVRVMLRHLPRLGFNFGLGERLEVEIPAAWLGDIDVRTSSGDLRVYDAFSWQKASLSASSGAITLSGDISAESLSLNVNSGSIRAQGALTVAGSLQAEGSSGAIHLEGDVQAADMRARVNSGRINLRRVEVGKFDLRGSSGNITAESISGGGQAQVNSGSINLTLCEPLADVELQSSSGDIRLNLPPEAAFTFSGQVSSGSIRSNFPLDKNEKGDRASASVGSAPTFAVNAECNSGSITINR